jgi:hypothetical protein
MENSTGRKDHCGARGYFSFKCLSLVYHSLLNTDFKLARVILPTFFQSTRKVNMAVVQVLHIDPGCPYPVIGMYAPFMDGLRK